MKYTITHTAEWILLTIITALLVFTAWKAYTLKDKVEYINTTDTIQFCDTIVDFQPQYVYVDHFDTTLLPVLISDTVTDTLFVQIPVSTYQYDTVISDTNYTTHFSASLTGYKLSFDTLCLSTEIIENKPIPIGKKWYNHIAPACGVGIGTDGKIGLFVGIGYTL